MSWHLHEQPAAVPAMQWRRSASTPACTGLSRRPQRIESRGGACGSSFGGLKRIGAHENDEINGGLPIQFEGAAHRQLLVLCLPEAAFCVRVASSLLVRQGLGLSFKTLINYRNAEMSKIISPQKHSS